MTQTPRPDAHDVIRFCNEALPAKCRKAIEVCARRGYGERRNLRAILLTANEMGADPRVCAAAFLYLPSIYGVGYVDVTDLTGFETADLPDDLPVFAAFALARLALGGAELCPIAYSPR